MAVEFMCTCPANASIDIGNLHVLALHHAPFKWASPILCSATFRTCSYGVVSRFSSASLDLRKRSGSCIACVRGPSSTIRVLHGPRAPDRGVWIAGSLCHTALVCRLLLTPTMLPSAGPHDVLRPPHPRRASPVHISSTGSYTESGSQGRLRSHESAFPLAENPALARRPPPTLIQRTYLRRALHLGTHSQACLLFTETGIWPIDTGECNLYCGTQGTSSQTGPRPPAWRSRKQPPWLRPRDDMALGGAMCNTLWLRSQF